MRVELELYTPREAEPITCVTQATVRNWRRADYLKRHSGHARYTIADLLEMYSMGLLVKRGIEPSVAAKFSGEMARSLFQSMIWKEKTYSDDAIRMAKELVFSGVEQEFSDLKAAGCAENREGFREAMHQIAMLEKLAEASEQLAGISGLKRPDWLVIWADDTVEFFHDDDEESVGEAFFGNISFAEAYAQGLIVLAPLQALASSIVDRLPRPAIKTKLEDE